MNENLLSEYINKRMSAIDLQNEIKRLIRLYNDAKKTYLLIYAVDFEKGAHNQGLNVGLSMSDYQIIHEMLRNLNKDKIDLYLETPGGSGEAAEEIVNFLHSKFDSVDFLIAGEAKSAGTLMAMSADEIYMTDSGSLGPIDAQVRIGRTTVSAFDYVDWIDRKREEVEKGTPLNAVDAAMLAQISPGEYMGVFHAQEFAKDKLKEWLPNYKFKHWKETETRKISVDDEFKIKRAEEIAKKMIDHSTWRSHGKSLKITDLEDIGLRINKVDDLPDLSEIVYRIKSVIKLLFGGSTFYKIFVTADEHILQSAMAQKNAANIQQNIQTPVVELRVNCPKCGKQHPLYAKFGTIPEDLEQQMASKSKKFPVDNKIQCDCGFTIDITAIHNQLENQLGSKILD
ncbi:MAG: hypothetical protein Ta2F_03030 [Termitinemataceae bacterium]|nr:MAG: hypothetical protein Ta2F_03030 [Termitinemataceae bacterium]